MSKRQRDRFKYGLFLDDVEGALWKQPMIDAARVVAPPEMARVVIGVDPAVSNKSESDRTGIVVAGEGVDGKYYILCDASMRADPVTWAKEVVSLYYGYDADRVIGEVNNGGDLIESLLRQVDADIPFRAVRASRGKILRAEPVAALYEKGKVRHVGIFPELEEEMTSYNPQTFNGSPDRMDALVWAVTELSRGGARFVLA